MNKTFKHWSAVAATLVICAGLFSIQPVQVAAAEFLKLFRVQEVKAISLSQKDLSDIEAVFEKGEGSVDINDMIKCEVNSDGDEEYIDNPDAASIKQKYPAAKVLTLPEGYHYSNAAINPKTDVTLMLDVKKSNEFLRYLGEKTQFPELLDQKPFVIHSDNVLHYSIQQNSSNSEYYFDVTQMDAPAFEVPDGVDADQLASVILSMDIMPQDLRQQLISMGDLTSTFPFPYDTQREVKEDITINGQDAILIRAKESQDEYFRLCFKENDYLVVVNGRYPMEKLLPLLETME